MAAFISVRLLVFMAFIKSVLLTLELGEARMSRIWFGVELSDGLFFERVCWVSLNRALPDEATFAELAPDDDSIRFSLPKRILVRSM